MSDLLISPQFDRPPQPQAGGWLKRALGGALWEAPLFAAILAASVNCAYAPPAQATLDVRSVSQPESSGWLNGELPLFNAPFGVGPADARRNNSFRVDARTRPLDVSTHLTAPNQGWLTALSLWPGAAYAVPSAQDARLRSYVPPARATFLLGTHDTAPQNTPFQIGDALFNASQAVASDDALRNCSFIVPPLAAFRPGLHDLVPA